eukprot:scaffold14075_cov72-Cyclotella_meneghiniana.AAC.1
MPIKPALLRFKLDNIANASSEYYHSDALPDGDGNKWKLVWLHEDMQKDKSAASITLFLHSKNKKSLPLSVTFTVAVKDANGKSAQEWHDETTFKADERGGAVFNADIDREVLMSNAKHLLKDGALCFDVTIQIKGDRDTFDLPRNNLSDKMLSLLSKGEKADLVFIVEGRKFNAHSLIIGVTAPILINFAQRQNEHSNSIITDTTPQVFQHILEYVYSGYLPPKNAITKWGKELIDAANRYEIVTMKTAIEKALVQQCVISKENVADYISFSDAQSCPLLKEYAISYFLLHANEVLQSKHSKPLRDSAELLAEIMILMTSGDGAITISAVTELGSSTTREI